MFGIEVWRNGELLYTAAVDGILTARLTIRNQIDPIWFDVRGRDRQSGGHADWSHLCVNEGDEFRLKLVRVDKPQNAIAS